jgi:hypothetical protein
MTSFVRLACCPFPFMAAFLFIDIDEYQTTPNICAAALFVVPLKV